MRLSLILFSYSGLDWAYIFGGMAFHFLLHEVAKVFPSCSILLSNINLGCLSHFASIVILNEIGFLSLAPPYP